MHQLLTLNTKNYEFTYFTVMTVKNASAIQAMENRLNIMAEAINELIDKSSGVDLEAFKAIFLKELEALLNSDGEFEFSNHLLDLLKTEKDELTAENALLKLRLEALTARVSKIESVLGHLQIEKTEKFNAFDLLG